MFKYLQFITLWSLYINILSTNLKVYFPRWCFWHYGMQLVMDLFVLMYYLKQTSCIQINKSENKGLNVFSVNENSPKMKEGEFGSSVSAILCGRTWTIPEQRLQNISVTFKDSKQKQFFHNIKNMTFIAKNNYFMKCNQFSR